jgi:hypothetical protein
MELKIMSARLTFQDPYTKKNARTFEWINDMEIHPLVKWVSWKCSNFSAEIAHSMTKKNAKLFENLWTKYAKNS